MRRYQDDLAWVHHTGFADLARGAAPNLIALLRARGIRSGTVVDLGCGSGLVLRALLRAGYAAHGVDLSAAMVALARRVAPRSTVKQGSLYSARLPPSAAIFAVGEPLNYVDAGAAAAREADLPRFFARVRRALLPGGLFAFDVIVRGRPSLSRARHVAGRDFDLFVTTRDEGAVLWRDVVCFARRPGQAAYARSHELHRVRVLQASTLKQQLRAAGFLVRSAPSYGSHRLPVRRLAFLCTT
jgi:SAM-dependent methyltransferase